MNWDLMRKQIAAAENALRDWDDDEGNWPTGEELEVIIAASNRAMRDWLSEQVNAE